MNTQQPTQAIRFAHYLLFSLAWLGAMYLISRFAATRPFGITVFSVLLLAIPVALSGAYTSTVAQIRNLRDFKPTGWLFKIFSRRFLQTMLWMFWALASSFIVFLQIILYTREEWAALILCIFVFWGVFRLTERLLSSELKTAYLVTDLSIRWSRNTTPFIMLLAYGGYLVLTGSTSNFNSLTDALTQHRKYMPEHTDSVLVMLGLEVLTASNAMKDYAASHLGAVDEYLPIAIKAVGSFVLFFNACASLSCLLIPGREYLRVFGPLTDEDTPPSLTKPRLALVSALSTVFVVFIYIPLFAHTETAARENPKIGKTIEEIVRQVEKIDNDYFNVGTIQQIKDARLDAIRQLELSKVVLDGKIDRAFDQVVYNVDGYLNWYYSLPAEYLRIGHLLTGNSEGYLKENLTKYLMQGEAINSLNKEMETALISSERAMSTFQAKKKEILEANRILDDGKPINVVESSDLASLETTPKHIDAIQLQDRMAGGAVAAAIGAALTTKIASKAMFKTAAKAAAKAAASKIAGPAIGGGIGAAIGSVVPFLGTAIGGVIGGIVGGVVVDGALLSLEEAISRNDFKQDLIKSINETRQEFKSRLFPATKRS
ncbi:MAG: hypothetical protein FIB06_05505 [Betaproteobacteria bacterium]|nr:hypothetical protein [Betaproteobacteria bacterium]